MHNEVFVLDEPIVGRIIINIFSKCSRAPLKGYGVLSTHQLSVAEEVADRIGAVHMGKLVAVGTEEELHNLGGEGNAEWKRPFCFNPKNPT